MTDETDSGAALLPGDASASLSSTEALPNWDERKIGIEPQPGLCNARDYRGVLCVKPAGHEAPEHQSVRIGGLVSEWLSVPESQEPEPRTETDRIWDGMTIRVANMEPFTRQRVIEALHYVLYGTFLEIGSGNQATPKNSATTNRSEAP